LAVYGNQVSKSSILGNFFLLTPSARKNRPETTIALLSLSGRLRSGAIGAALMAVGSLGRLRIPRLHVTIRPMSAMAIYVRRDKPA